MQNTEEEYQEYRKNMRIGNFLRQPYFKTQRCDENKGMLNFPTIERVVGEDTCLEYVISDDELQQVLDDLNTLKGYAIRPINLCHRVPTESDHEEYYFRDAKIIFYNGYNYIVAPTFFKTGATAYGWCIFVEN